MACIRSYVCFCGTLVAGWQAIASMAAAETLFHRAENQVPVAIVEIKRAPEHTEIHLQAQAAVTKVCFAASGPNSPYLLASGQNYRYLGGDTSALNEQEARAEERPARAEPLARAERLAWAERLA